MGQLTGQIVHHVRPIRAGRFPLAFKSAARGKWNMTFVADRAAHQLVHQWLRRLDRVDFVRTWTSPIRTAGALIMAYVNRVANGAEAVSRPSMGE